MTDVGRVCGSATEPLARSHVLGNVPATYERCGRCGLVMAVKPHWLDSDYAAPITHLDTWPA
jgi:hypothetical protein